MFTIPHYTPTPLTHYTPTLLTPHTTHPHPSHTTHYTHTHPSQSLLHRTVRRDKTVVSVPLACSLLGEHVALTATILNGLLLSFQKIRKSLNLDHQNCNGHNSSSIDPIMISESLEREAFQMLCVKCPDGVCQMS